MVDKSKLCYYLLDKIRGMFHCPQHPDDDVVITYHQESRSWLVWCAGKNEGDELCEWKQQFLPPEGQ